MLAQQAPVRYAARDTRKRRKWGEAKMAINKLAEYYRQRADEMGDSMRRYLVGVNSGGIGILAVLVGKGDSLKLQLIAPLLCFSIGLIFTGVSVTLQKHKALRRKEAAAKNKEEPNFDVAQWRNETYDLISFAFFGAGILAFFWLQFASLLTVS